MSLAFLFVSFSILFLFKIQHISSRECYRCTESGENSYPYIINENSLLNFDNCTIVSTEKDNCNIQIWWTQQQNVTKIHISDSNIGQNTSRKDSVGTYVSYLTPYFGIYSGVYYYCYTDRCNDPSKLKLLLQATTTTTFTSTIIQPFLTPPLPLSSCLFYNNKTELDYECEILSANITQCSSCVTKMKTTNNGATLDFCAGCNVSPIFSYSDRTIYILDANIQITTETEIRCNNQPNCNTISTIQNIQKQYKNEFNSQLFLGSTGTTITYPTLSLWSFVLLLIIFLN